MTSTTLKSKNNFSNVMAKVFKQKLANMIALIVASAIVSVLAITLTFYNNAYGVYYKTTSDITFNAIVVIGVTTVICGLMSLSIAPRLFSEIYKKQSCDMYFSLPIKREDYYCANYVYGALLNIAGIITSTVLFSVITPMLSTKMVTMTIDAAVVAKCFFSFLISLLAVYSAFIMCAVTAGKRIHFILLALICLLCTSPTLTGILANLNSIWGLSVNGSKILSLDPMTAAITGMFDDTKGFIIPIIISLLEAVGMFFAGLIIFRKRRAEVAEVSLAGKVIPYALLALMVLALFLQSSGYTPVLSIILGIIIAVLATMAFTGIFYRKVFTKQTAITTGAVCLVGVMFICAVNLPSYSSYVKRVPEASQVERIEISNVTMNTVYLSLIANLLNSYNVDLNADEPITITDEKAIEKAIALHEKIVSDNVINATNHTTATQNLLTMIALDSYYDTSYEDTFDCNIKYTLKSGKTFTRTYSVSTKYLVDEYAELIRNEEVINQLYPFTLTDEDILYSRVSTYYPDEYYDMYDSDFNEYLYYDQSFELKNYDDFKKLYLNELLEYNNTTLINALWSMSNWDGFYYETYSSYEPYLLANITLYYIYPSAPDDIREKLSSMSAEEIKSGYTKYIYAYSSTENLYEYVGEATINIYDNQTNSIKSLEDAGIKFPQE